MKRYLPFIIILALVAVVVGGEFYLSGFHSKSKSKASSEVAAVFKKYPPLAGLGFAGAFDKTKSTAKLTALVGCVPGGVANTYACIYVGTNKGVTGCFGVAFKYADSKYSIVTAKTEPLSACGLS